MSMESIPNYDKWKTACPEPDPEAKCDCCGCDLWKGDGLWTVDGEYLCDDCVRDNYRRVL